MSSNRRLGGPTFICAFCRKIKDFILSKLPFIQSETDDDKAVEDIVRKVNKSLDDDTAEETHTLLQKPEGKFPSVLNRSAFLYHNELRKVNQESEQSELSHEIICHHLTAITLVAVVNEAIEELNSDQLIKHLKNAGLTSVEESQRDRYLTEFISAKGQKIRRVHRVEQSDLIQSELQKCLDIVKNEVAAVVAINQAIDQQDALKTVKALSYPCANLQDVFPELEKDYQSALFLAKTNKGTKSQAQARAPGTEGTDSTNNEKSLTHAEIQGIISQINDDYLQETLIERLVGLKEMFPDPFRKGSGAAGRGALRVAKWLYSFTTGAGWALALRPLSSSLIFAGPAIIELERAHEMKRPLQQQQSDGRSLSVVLCHH